MRQDGEPSVEEILDSIKRVIARDNRGHAQAARQERSTKVRWTPVAPVSGTSGLPG